MAQLIHIVSPNPTTEAARPVRRLTWGETLWVCAPTRELRE